MMEKTIQLIEMLVTISPAVSIFLICVLSLLVVGLALFVVLNAIRHHQRKGNER